MRKKKEFQFIRGNWKELKKERETKNNYKIAVGQLWHIFNYNICINFVFSDLRQICSEE